MESRIRKIIHIDMDCFYAAVELREQPHLRGRPVAVGGRSGRGVLTTCNYEARAFGCHSAMPVFKALQLCPQLVLLPVRHDLYKHESQRIREIFAEYTDLIEPLSLDEAYLDVSHFTDRSGASLAEEIRTRIRETTGLTASAGIASSKFLAKVASDWRKPDGQFEVAEADIDDFVRQLPVSKIWGVGQRTGEKLTGMGIHTCGDLQQYSLVELDRCFGRFGQRLHELCRGRDSRPVRPHREVKSVSNERTFPINVDTAEEGLRRLVLIIEELAMDCSSKHDHRIIRERFVKIKFEDFSVTTTQRVASDIEVSGFTELLEEGWSRGGGKAVRLIGAGVRFHSQSRVAHAAGQLEMF